VVNAELRVAGWVVRVLLTPRPFEVVRDFLLFRILLLLLLLVRIFFLFAVLRSALVQRGRRRNYTPCRRSMIHVGTVLGVFLAAELWVRLAEQKVLVGRKVRGSRVIFALWQHVVAVSAVAGVVLFAVLWVLLTHPLASGERILTGDEGGGFGGGRRLDEAPRWDLVGAGLAVAWVVLLAILCVLLAEHLTVGVAILACDEGSAVDGKVDGRSRRRGKRIATPRWGVRILAVPAEVVPAVFWVELAEHLALRVAILSWDKREWINRQREDGAGEQSHQAQDGFETEKHCVVGQVQVTLKLQKRE
jgi:hypothetical protein